MTETNIQMLSVNGKNLSEIREKEKQKPSAHMGTHGADIMNGPDIELIMQAGQQEHYRHNEII